MDEQVRPFLSVTEAMQLAMAEAAKGAPFVSPNPAVGCVILDSEGYFLKSGYHKKFGLAHAEINALEGLSHEQIIGAHVIVTLEPCAHQGKTPSCARALAQLPIAKVTYGLRDPNPLVAGKGADILRAAGKDVVEFGSLKVELEETCEAFLLNQRENKIFVALKVATSLDGQMAMKSGESQWITGEKSRERGHYLRACYDAVVVGCGTVKSDNPTLNIRHSEIMKFNKVVVLDPEGGLLSQYSNLNISKSHRNENVFWCIKSDLNRSESPHTPRILKVRRQGSDFDLDHLMALLWQEGLRSVFVEGGAYTLTQFIKAKWAHRLYIFIGPHLMGAANGLSWTQLLSIGSLKSRVPLAHLRSEAVGEDLLITGKFQD